MLEAAVDIAPSAVEYGYDMVISVSSVLFRAGAAVITFISSSISFISSLAHSLVSGTIFCLVAAANFSASAVGQAIHGTAQLCSWLWDTMSVVATHGLNASDVIGRGAITIAYVIRDAISNVGRGAITFTYVIGDAISSVFSFIFSLISGVVDFLSRELSRWLLQQCGHVIQHYLLPQGGGNQDDGGGHQLENDGTEVGNGHQIGVDRPGCGGHQLEIAGNRAPQISNVVRLVMTALTVF